jgi:hypothetical protein
MSALKGWDCVPIGNEILKIMQTFFNAIPQRLLSLPGQPVGTNPGNYMLTSIAMIQAGKTDVSTPWPMPAYVTQNPQRQGP